MKKTSILAASLILHFSFPLYAQVLKPGLWQSSAHFKVNGVPVPETQDENCVRSEDVKDVKSTVTDQSLLPATTTLLLKGQWLKACK